ncbi:Uma2 family endonuclease [Streptomyces sp. NPDC059076]|uniref:Uma2 family endonuclease n=1 Tax=unclassified Streptomyces TaxID=2593676 RepID=UPI003687D621
MTSATAGNARPPQGQPWDDLLHAWRELEVRDGWRAEIDGGKIDGLPPPHVHHNHIAAKVQRALYPTLPEDLEIYQTLGVHIAPLGKLYIPDLVVAPGELIASASPDRTDPVDAAEALLIVEITSQGNAKDDRTKKLWTYAHAPVPVHLLIDRFDEHGPTSTLFTKPHHGSYQHAERVPFGQQVRLPVPFDLKLDTAAFPH